MGRLAGWAASDLKPLRQGELDGLCGLYAVINALRLGMAETAPLTNARSRELAGLAIDRMYRWRRPSSNISCGMDPKHQRALANLIAQHVSGVEADVVFERCTLDRHASIDDAFSWVEQSLQQGKPVLALLSGAHDHFTVIRGITDRSLVLFDSAGRTRLSRAHCGITSGRHRIVPTGLMRIAIHPTRHPKT